MDNSVPARWAAAVHLFVDGAGRPSTARDAHRVTVGVTRDWRVSVIVPDELAGAPEFTGLLGERVAEMERYARRRAEVAAAVAAGEVVLAGPGHSCPDCEDELCWHSPGVGCWICDCPRGVAPAGASAGSRVS